MNTVGTPTLQWLTVIYMIQTAFLPILSIVLIPFGLRIFSLIYWQPMIWLHIAVFAPPSIFNTLYLVFGQGESAIVRYLDDIAIFLIYFGTANAGLAALSIGFVFFFF